MVLASLLYGGVGARWYKLFTILNTRSDTKIFINYKICMGFAHAYFILGAFKILPFLKLKECLRYQAVFLIKLIILSRWVLAAVMNHW